MKIKLGWLLAILTAICALAVVFSIGAGTMRLTPLEVVRALLGFGSEEHRLLINQLRLPRILVALLVGASLAAAGAILQGMLRNALASPDVIGVTDGASAVAVAFLTLSAGAFGIRLLPFAALAGAGVTALLLYAIAWKRGITPFRLILVGIGLSAVLSALTTLMILFNPQNEAGQAYVWLAGSVYGSSWENVWTIMPWTLALVPLSLLHATAVDIVQLGDESARAVGVRLQLHRLLLLGVSVGLAGSAVAVAGGIGFVGLVAPHIARRLTGPIYSRLLPASVLLGAIIVVLADLAGRTLFRPADVPAGALTAAVGAPFFLYLLYAGRKRR